ncbi:MAG: glucose-6-phosphate isomerase [Micavibrio sp.]|nr:glucose-6-phosphate isomerase [Micavibrio sp.]
MSNNPTQSQYWKSLEKLHKVIENSSIVDLFQEDSDRFNSLSFSIKGLHYDISKNKITLGALALLLGLAKEQNLKEEKQKLFNGDIVNKTENRSALHTNQRDGTADLIQLTKISEDIRNKKWLGATGKPIKNIVHIGLGGSGLGPELIYDAFLEQKTSDINFHFVTNIDGTNLTRALASCEPETTLFIVVSKSFTTQETRVNSDTAREWLKKSLNTDTFISKHFIAITANPEKAQAYGIDNNNVVAFDEGVGGRFSLWSAVSLTTSIAFGIKNFKDLLNGAHDMDKHFEMEALETNIPVIMALIDIWHRNFCGYQAKVILPYAQELKAFPDYLQQLEMESNGKNIDLDGNIIAYKTSPIIFGGVGTTSQHSFFQLLHQGTDIIPCDFIGVKTPNHDLKDHHDKLLNNFLAQPQALMQGKKSDSPHKQFLGDRPCSSIILDKMDSYHLGTLIALYEHKVFVQSIIWNINAFDQFGVELGKEMAHKIENNELNAADPSTKALFSLIKDDK